MEDPKQYQVRVKDLADDTIEKMWIPLWNKVPNVALSKDDANMLIGIMMTPEEKCKEIMQDMLTNKSESIKFAARITAESMMPRFDIKLTYQVQCFLTAIFKSPGNSVMIFAYMKWKLHELHLDKVTMEVFARNIFPWGLPDEAGFSWLWDCQKLRAETQEEWEKAPGTGNLLDVGRCYKSFC